MSWKSLVTAGLFCILASPAFAAPTLSVTKSGTVASGNLDASGNWSWAASVTPDLGIVTGGTGTPVAVELGFTSTSTGTVAGQGGLKAVSNSNPTVFDTSTPGTTIFGWEVPYTPAGGTSKPEGLEVNCTGCTVTNTAANPTTGGHPTTLVAGTANQIFAALGSSNITTPGAVSLLSIVTNCPKVTFASPITSNKIQVSGAYTGNGRIAKINGANSANFDPFGGETQSYTRNARGGDSDLNGVNDFNDFQNGFVTNYLLSGKNWSQGDYDGNGTVDFNDFQILATQYQLANYTVGPTTLGAGAGLSAGGAVPEPASIAMLGLALVGGMGMIRRKR